MCSSGKRTAAWFGRDMTPDIISSVNLNIFLHERMGEFEPEARLTSQKNDQLFKQRWNSARDELHVHMKTRCPETPSPRMSGDPSSVLNKVATGALYLGMTAR